MSLVDAIGVIGTAFTIVGFLQSNWPAGESPEGATVTIKAGLPALNDEEASLGGSISKVYGFDERNGFAGEADGGSVDSGGIITVTVDQEVAGRRAGYIGVANNNDATCISWITVKQFDGTDGGAWTGDIGFNCGQNWYASEEPAGKLKDSSEDYIPRCTWIDGDHTNDIISAAMKFDVGAYGGEKVQDTVNNNACGPTLWGNDNAPINGQPGKRAVKPRPAYLEEALIMSNRTSQSAKELCSSATSWGPDFVGGDGKFCDMGSKTLYSLCSHEEVDGCVEIDDVAGTVAKRQSVARRTAGKVHKSYGKVKKWGY